MAIRSLDNFRKLRLFITGMRRRWLNFAHGVEIHPSCSISLSSRMVASRRGAISVGEQTLIAFKSLLYTRHAGDDRVLPIRIGRHCFIGGGVVITPGVTVGDESIVAAGSVVFDDVPPRCIVGGNPARILRRDVTVHAYGQLDGSSDMARRTRRE